MEIGETVRELLIEKIVAGGEGLGRVVGGDSRKIVFVPFVLPGERVLARIVEGRGGFERGELLEVLEPSPERVLPRCPVFEKCGGCDLQHVSYEEQLRLKLDIVRESFLRVGKLPEHSLPVASISIIPGEPYGYRNRIQLHTGGGTAAGFKARRSDTVVPITECPVVHPSVNGYLAALSDNGKAGDTAAEPPGRRAVIGTDEALAVEGQSDVLEIQILGKRITLSPSVFFQSNLHMVENLVPYVVEGTKDRDVADLYAGVGLFSVFLFDHARMFRAVEEDSDGARLARINLTAGAGASGRMPAEVSAMRVERWLRGLRPSSVPEIIVVDPPRAGLSAQARSLIIQKRIPEVRYVSCNPVTLARDAGELIRAGYAAGPCVVFDFYPQTAHVESFLTFTLERGRSS